MKNKIVVNKQDIRNLQKDITKAIDLTMADTYKFYINETPKRSGNARNNTKFNKRTNTISSNYDYSNKLDSGSSRQAPKGFTKPSLDYLEDKLTREFKRI